MVRTRGGGHAAACHMTGRRRGVGCGAGTVAPGGGRPRPIRQGVGYEAEAPAAVAAHPALGRPRPRPRPRESRSVRRAFLARPVRRRCAAPPRPLFPKGGRMRRTAPLPRFGRAGGGERRMGRKRPARTACRNAAVSHAAGAAAPHFGDRRNARGAAAAVANAAPGAGWIRILPPRIIRETFPRPRIQNMDKLFIIDLCKWGVAGS